MTVENSLTGPELSKEIDNTKSSPLLWPESSLHMAVSALVALLAGVTLSATGFNSLERLQEWFVEYHPIADQFLFYQFFMLMAALGIAFAYRRIRRKRSTGMDLLCCFGIVILTVYAYYGLSASLAIIFEPAVANRPPSQINFSGPSPSILSACWLLMTLLAITHSIKRTLRKLGSRLSLEVNEQKRTEISKQLRWLTVLRWISIVFWAASLVSIPVQSYLLIAHTTTSFVDIGTGLLLGIFSFWLIVMIINSVYAYFGYDWPGGRAQTSFMSGYSLIVTMIVYFYCNDASGWVIFATAVLIIMSGASMISYKNTFGKEYRLDC